MTHPAFDLSGKVALVTGANSGLGLGFARGVARAGADVAIWGRRQDRNEAVAAELRHMGVRVLAQEVDVACETRVATAVAEVVEELGRIDCVVANAGMVTRPLSFLELSTSAFEELLAVNLHGAVFTLREGIRHFLARGEVGDGGGSLVVCGSLSVKAGVPRLEHYAAAKGALAAVTRSIAVEYGPHGIRANMVLPGRFHTELGGPRTEHPLAERMTAANPIRRMGTLEDLEGIAVYLMSDASAYHTGDLITIDGGLSITLL